MRWVRINSLIVLKKPQQIYDELFVEVAPLSKTKWAEAILSTLSWPGGKTPSRTEKASPKVRYMPVGIYRFNLASDNSLGTPMRQLIVDKLSKDLQKTP